MKGRLVERRVHELPMATPLSAQEGVGLFEDLDRQKDSVLVVRFLHR